MEREAKRKVRIGAIFKRNAEYVYRRAAEGNLNKKNAPLSQRNFNLFTALLCLIFFLCLLQFDQPRENSTDSPEEYEEEEEAVDAGEAVEEEGEVVIEEEEIYSQVEDVLEYPSNSCQPQKYIVFLKTHKCASSSIQNIFSRYGYRRGLTFVLPAKGSYIGHPEPFNWTMVPDAEKFGLHYNILTHHCRLNYEEIKRKFPDDVKVITIVRQPVELYESLFSFYSLHKFYRERFDTLGKHGKPPSSYDKRMGGKIGFNQMLFDLGMDEKFFSNLSAVHDYVHYLDSIFDLVMVREKMEESLILLRDLLCLRTDDVVVFHLNARNKRYKRKMSPDLLQRIVKFNSADIVLYEYFLRKLEQRIEEYGKEKMKEEVEKLKNRTQMWYDLCVQRQDFQSRVISSKRYYVNRMVMAYVKKNQMNDTCDDLTTQEAVFTEKLVYKQRFMFPKPKPYRYRYKSRLRRWR